MRSPAPGTGSWWISPAWRSPVRSPLARASFRSACREHGGRAARLVPAGCELRDRLPPPTCELRASLLRAWCEPRARGMSAPCPGHLPAGSGDSHGRAQTRGATGQARNVARTAPGGREHAAGPETPGSRRRADKTFFSAHESAPCLSHGA